MSATEYSATMQASGRARAAVSNAVGSTIANASTADTDVGTVVTDFTTAITAYQTFAAALIAITGDTFSNTTNLFTFGGATGLTHAQWATLGAELNTAISDFLTAQTDTATAKVATAATVTSAGQITSGGDVTVRVNSLANVPTRTLLKTALDAIQHVIKGSSVMTP